MLQPESRGNTCKMRHIEPTTNLEYGHQDANSSTINSQSDWVSKGSGKPETYSSPFSFLDKLTYSTSIPPTPNTRLF